MHPTSVLDDAAADARADALTAPMRPVPGRRGLAARPAPRVASRRRRATTCRGRAARPWPTPWSSGLPGGRDALRGLVQLGPRRRPRRAARGAALRVVASRGLAGIDGCVSTAVGLALASDVADLRADGRPDLPARRQRAAHRSAGTPARPHRGRDQRRRRRHLHPPRAGRARAGGRLRAALRHPDGHRPGRALCAPTALRTNGSRPATSSSPRWPSAPSGSGSSRCRRPPTVASSTRASASAPLPPSATDPAQNGRLRARGRCQDSRRAPDTGRPGHAGPGTAVRAGDAAAYRGR